MCGRIAPEFLEYLEKKYAISSSHLPELARMKKTNLCPTDRLPAILLDSARVQTVVPAFWRFLPSTVKTAMELAEFSKTYSTTNARSESVRTQRLYSHAFVSQRCVVPIRGFFEWKTVEGERTKRPYWITSAVPHAGIAALYNHCEYLGDCPSLTLLTTEASPGEMQGVHHRMPVLLREEQFGEWLGDSADQAEAMMKPTPSKELRFQAVARLINTPSWDGEFEELLKEEVEGEELQGDLFR